MEEKIVFRSQSEKGKEIVIRYPTKDDANAMWEYINLLSKERTYIRFQGEEVSLEEEITYLNLELEKIAKNKTVLLLVFFEGKLIGISGIDMRDKIEKHIGVFGISIAKEFRGEGIGTKLMEIVMEEGKKQLKGLEIIILGLFKSNTLAKEMYEKFGFSEFGMLPKGIKLEEGHIDHVFMYKVVKE